MVITKSLQLDSDHFNFDLTPGFEMAVEKEWNVLDFADINQSITMYDSSHNAYVPNRYGVRIFYKAVIPMCYVDGETYETNPLVRTASRGVQNPDIVDLINGTAIGSPVLKMTQGTKNASFEYGYHGLLIADDVPTDKAAYALPSDSDLNDTTITKSDFASGSSISKLKDDSYYLPLDTGTYYDDLLQNGEYILLGPGGQNSGGVASFIVNNGALAYTIDTSSNSFNLPSDNEQESGHKYLLPLLFKPFGVAFKDVLDQNDNTAGWFYCVLGVKDFGDPSYNVDPAIERFAYGDAYVDPTEGTYNYGGSTFNTIEDLEITVYDNVEITAISINNVAIQVPTPVNNKYTIDSAFITGDGVYDFSILTLDNGDNQLTYSYTFTYEQEQPQPSGGVPFQTVSVDGTNYSMDVEGEEDVTSYTQIAPSLDDYTSERYIINIYKADPNDEIANVACFSNDVEYQLDPYSAVGPDAAYYIPVSANASIQQYGFVVTFESVATGLECTVTFTAPPVE